MDPFGSPELLASPAVVFGIVFDLFLFGILTVQTYVYHISFPKDRVLLKIAVGGVYLAGVTQTGLVLVDVHSAAKASIANRLLDAHTRTILKPEHSLWLPALTAVVATVIQSLYAQRVYVISKKLWLAAIIICMSVGQFASGILGAICYRGATAVISTVPNQNHGWMIASGRVCDFGFKWIWGPFNIICDLTITICMVTFLIRHRKRAMRRQTRSHITKIIQIIIETGMAATILMVIYTVLFCLWAGRVLPSSLSAYYSLAGLIMSKVYSNSMLVLVNRRATVATGKNAIESLEMVEISAEDHEGDIRLRTVHRNSMEAA